MPENNFQQKGPIDYGKFFEEQKSAPIQQAQIPNQPLTQPVIGESAQQRPGFLGKIIDSWTFSEKGTKIEVVIFFAVLAITAGFLIFYFATKEKTVTLPPDYDQKMFFPQQ